MKRPLPLWFTSNEVLWYLSLFFGLVIFAPQFFWPALYNQYFTAKLVFVLVICSVLVVSVWWFRRNLVIPAGKWLLMFFGLFLASGFFSAWLGGDLTTSWWGVFGRGEYSLFASTIIGFTALAVWTILTQVRQLAPQEGTSLVGRAVTVLMVTLAGLLFVFALVEYKFFPGRNGYSDGGVIRLTLGYPNPLFLSYLLAPLVSYLFTWMLWSKTKSELIVRTFPFTASFLVIIWTYTRAAWIVVAVAMVIVIAVTLWLQRSKQTLVNIAATGLIMAVVVAFFWSGIRARNNDFVDKGSTQILQDLSRITGQDITDVRQFYPDQSAVANLTSTDIRLLELKWGWRLYTQNWQTILWGFGPEQEYYRLPAERPTLLNYLPTDANTKPYYIRNWYLHVLLTTGAAGLLVILLPQLLLGWVVGRWLWVERKKPTEQHAFVLMATAAVLAFVGYGMAYTAEITSYLGFVLMVVMLAWLVQPRGEPRMQWRIPVGRWGWAAILVALLTIVPLIRLWMYDDYFAQAVNPQSTQEQSLRSAWRARQWWPYQDGGYRAVASISLTMLEGMLDLYGSFQPPSDVPSVAAPLAWDQLQQGKLNQHQTAAIFHREILDDLKRLETRANVDHDNLRVISSSYYKLVRLDRDKESGFPTDRYYMTRALQYGYQSIAADPSLPVPYDELGLQQLYVHNLPEAERLFNKAIELKSDYWFSYLHLGELYRQRCEPQKALDFYEKAKPYVPLAEGEISEANVELRAIQNGEGCKYTVWTKKDLESMAIGQKKNAVIKKLGEPHLEKSAEVSQYFASTGECREVTWHNNEVTRVVACGNE